MCWIICVSDYWLIFTIKYFMLDYWRILYNCLIIDVLDFWLSDDFRYDYWRIFGNFGPYNFEISITKCNLKHSLQHLKVTNILRSFVNFSQYFEQIFETISGFVLAAFNLYFNYRVLDSVYMFLIVWYYCTLTIRESILKVNGSRIKVGGWSSNLTKPFCLS